MCHAIRGSDGAGRRVRDGLVPGAPTPIGLAARQPFLVVEAGLALPAAGPGGPPFDRDLGCIVETIGEAFEGDFPVPELRPLAGAHDAHIGRPESLDEPGQ